MAVVYHNFFVNIYYYWCKLKGDCNLLTEEILLSLLLNFLNENYGQH